MGITRPAARTSSTGGGWADRTYSFGFFLAPGSELDFGHARHPVADPGLSDSSAVFFAQTLHVAHSHAPVGENNRLSSDPIRLQNSQGKRTSSSKQI